MHEVGDGFIEKFMQKKEMLVHSHIFEDKLVNELDEAMEKGPHAIRKFSESMREEIADNVDGEGLSELQEFAEKRDKDLIESQDSDIIKFYTEDADKIDLEDIVNVSGLLINVLKVVDELDLRSYSIPKNVKSSSFFWLYLNMYEAILDIFTKSLYEFYTENSNLRDDEIIDKISDTIESGQHMAAGRLSSELEFLDVIDRDKPSLVSGRAKTMRNRVGHANVFFDDGKDEFVFADGERYDYSDFKEEFEYILQFLLEFLLSVGDENDLDDMVSEGIEEVSRTIDRGALKISRSHKDWQKIKMEVIN